MNWESWLPPKNSLMLATTGRMLISAPGVAALGSWMVMRSLTTRSMRSSPMRNWFCKSSPTERTRRLPRWSMSSSRMGPLSLFTELLASISFMTMATRSRGVRVRSAVAGSSSRRLFSL